MATQKIQDRVTALARSVVEADGLTLDRVEYRGPGRHAVLRVYIDKEGGATVEDCARVSEELAVILDVEDPIDGPYHLEVSTPGLDRPLRTTGDYERFAGRLVRLHTFRPIEGKREFLGRLAGLEGEAVRIEDRILGREVTVPLDAVSKAHLEIEL